MEICLVHNNMHWKIYANPLSTLCN